MNLFKLFVTATLTASTIIAVAITPSTASNVVKSVPKVEKSIKVGPIVLPTQTKIKAVAPVSYPSDVEDDYYNDSQTTDDDYNVNDEGLEQPQDEKGGHYGWHYDTDDNHDYDKTSEGHYGYHFDADEYDKDGRHLGNHDDE